MLSYAYNLPCHQLAGTGSTYSVLRRQASMC